MHEPRIIGIIHMLMWMLLTSVFSSLAHEVSSSSSSSTTDARPPVCAVSKFKNNNSPLEFPICYLDDGESENNRPDIAAESSGTTTAPPPVQTAATAAATAADSDSELDSESPLDTANFLSFEDWKKQNLAKIGQSADTVGSRQRQGGGERQTQARAMNNALDALGDDAEIDLDFGGFGAENNAESESWGRKVEDSSSSSGTNSGAGEMDSTQNAGDDSAEGVSAMGRRKDAGTTCKERFNYASFDCAATVLKTNPECSGSSSVLIENKDSYMLNECRAKNKFVILELCDDILVDTIVLANYEFFSSIFHTFRVSVSDRYPVKSDKWKDLGVFEAKNTRAVQAFAVANPLIWARYVRIEFLTHYGNEFYCPLSLVRIHGTTMLEEYKNEGENRVEEDMEEPSELADQAAATEAAASPVVSAHPENNTTVSTAPKTPDVFSNETSPLARNSLEEAVFGHFLAATCAATEYASMTTSVMSTPSQSSSPVATTTTSVKATDTTKTATSSSSEPVMPSEHVTGQPEHTNSTYVAVTSSITQQQQNSTQPESSASNSTTTATATTSSSKETTSSVFSAEATKVTPSNPPSPNPTTQESFFKSVNKRLQMLESNSSLSLLYIEEQSQILRDAFSKVEKRQLTKLNTFLDSLNATVIDEIRNLQDVYQSLRTIILDDFETQQREVSSTASQLAVLTDELVFQKRMTAISSVLIILLFALILIPRGGTGGGAVGSMIDFQSMMAWSPRQPSSPKTPKVPSSNSTEDTTPSTESKEDTQRRCNSRHVDYAAANGLPNGLPTGLSTESVPVTYAEKQTRTRSLSQLSETNDSGVYSPPPFSSDDLLADDAGVEPVTAETTPTLRAGLIPRLMMKRSPVVQHERPVSSPPVLTRTVATTAGAAGAAGAGLVVVSDSESDISTEPFPPFPQ